MVFGMELGEERCGSENGKVRTARRTNSSSTPAATRNTVRGRLRPREDCRRVSDGRAVVRVGRGECPVVETHTGEPPLMLERPVRPAPPHLRVAQQKLGEPVPGPGQVLNHVATDTTQVTDRFLRRSRHPDRGELTGSMQTREQPSVAFVGLHVIAAPLRDQTTVRSHRNAHPGPSGADRGHSPSGPPHNTPTPASGPRTDRSTAAPTPRREKSSPPVPDPDPGPARPPRSSPSKRPSLDA
jgi:hypothetical protein